MARNLLGLTRRKAMGQVIGAGLAVGLPLHTNAAATTSARASSGKIDVHFHVNLRPDGPPIDTTRFGSSTALRALADMDKGGVAAAICSPGGSFGDSDVGPQKIQRTRDWNNRTAQLCADHPSRFGQFVALPLPDIEGALREIEFAADLSADGLTVVTNYGDLWFGDLKLRPVYEEMNRRKAVVFVHPTNAPCCNPDRMSYQGDAAVDRDVRATAERLQPGS